MQQVGKKDKLSKSEILSAADFFKIGKNFAYSLVSGGNINSNYILKTESGKYILRAYKFKTEKEILSELGLLDFLSQNKFPCPKPVGKIFKTKNKFVCCFGFIEGHELNKVTENDLKKIAKLMAILHILTKNYRLKYKREGEGLKVIKQYLKIKKKDILNSKFRDSKNFIKFLETELNKLKLDRNLPSGAIHVDIKTENIIIGKDGNLSFIDFDNFYIDTYVTDIANAIMWLSVNEKEMLDLKKAKIFLREYNKYRKLSKREMMDLKESFKFYCLKGIFKYAYICLPRLKFAEHWAYHFIRVYNNILKQDIKSLYEL